MRRNDHFTKKDEVEESEEEEITINDIQIPREKIDLNFSRSSGPGGQNVNKLNTKAEIRFNLQTADWLDNEVKKKFKEMHKNYMNNFGEVIVTSQVGREQSQNLEDAFKKLRYMVFQASIKDKERSSDIPAQTETEHKRRIDSKRRKSDTKKMRSNKSDW